jgi:hypothetical protein
MVNLVNLEISNYWLGGDIFSVTFGITSLMRILHRIRKVNLNGLIGKIKIKVESFFFFAELFKG